MLALSLRGPEDPPLHMEPMMRIWFADRGLIAAVDPPIEPGERRVRRPVRRYALTERGATVLAACLGSGDHSEGSKEIAHDLQRAIGIDAAVRRGQPDQ
jgi:hypothetical protein